MNLVQLGMPLFADREAIEPKAVEQAWRTLFPNELRMRVARSEEGGLSCNISDSRVIVATHIAVPVPNDEALAAVRTTWMWQQPDDAVRTHAAHALVVSASEGNPVGRARDVTRVCAAMLAAGNGVALYWGNARQVLPAELVKDAVTEMEGPPVMLWVGVTVSAASKQGPFSAATHGLEAFGHKEFEVRDASSLRLGDLRMTLIDYAGYVLENGPVMKHGQSFGPDAQTKWTISHEPSTLVEGRDAIVLGIP